MGKTAKKRLQIVTVDGKSAAEAIHADDGTGQALCGYRRNVGLANRRGQKTKWKSLGSGTVTCGLCRKRHT
jgi:hypothetical protein